MPLETTKSTAAPVSASPPACGSWEMTRPFATSWLEASLTLPTSRPALRRAVSASVRVIPVMVGTCTWSGEDSKSLGPKMRAAAISATSRMMSRASGPRRFFSGGSSSVSVTAETTWVGESVGANPVAATTGTGGACTGLPSR